MIAIAKTIQNDLSRIADKNERLMLLAIRNWFDFTIRQLRRDMATKFKKDIISEFTDWKLIEGEGIKNIRPTTLKIMQTGGKEAYNTLAVQGSFSVLNVKAVEAANKMCAKLVTEVTDQTKKGIRLYVREGIKDGKSMPKLGRELRPLVGLTENQTQSVVNYRRLLEDKEKYPRLKPTDIDRKVQRYADKTHRRRATNIARTETARAQNIGYCQGLAENGVEQVEFLIAPTDACEDCVALNGEKYSVAEGENIIPVHPQCRCSMLPVIAGETLDESATETPEGLAPDMPPEIPGPEGFDYEAAGTDKQMRWEDKLTPAQLTSFDEYTAGETQLILNAQRRVLSGVAPSKLSAAEKVWYGHAQQVELALQRAPGFKGQVWRGMQFKNDKDPRLVALNRRLTSKKPFTFDNTTSFTGSKDFAAMVNQWDRVDDANKIKVMVRMKKAPKRSAYMGNLSGVEDEAEILVSARTKYRVVGRTEKVVGKTHYIQYDLEEVLPKIRLKPVTLELPKSKADNEVAKLKAAPKIEPVEPPEKGILLQQYVAENMSQTSAMNISQKLRETYPKKLTTRNFGEMENAVLAYDSFRTLALVDKQIIGAISFQWDEVSEVVYISHTGTLMSPKGTGAELVRTAVETAYKGRWGMSLESTYEAINFWKRLGFVQNKKVLYVFDADFKRVSQIREALGVIGRVKTEVK